MANYGTVLQGSVTPVTATACSAPYPYGRVFAPSSPATRQWLRVAAFAGDRSSFAVIPPEPLMLAGHG